jgi:hypothetical protein
MSIRIRRVSNHNRNAPYFTTIDRNPSGFFRVTLINLTPNQLALVIAFP